MCNVKDYRYFAQIGKPRTVWTIPAIHGDLQALIKVHDQLMTKIKAGDRIVYHGNYTGFGDKSSECIDEILTFRRMVLALPGLLASDLVYLRGQQEQIWMKLMQLHFAPNPVDILLWMLGNGLSSTLYSYGLSPHDGVDACKQGTISIAKWLDSVRIQVRKRPGHASFIAAQQRAAYTDQENDYPMLFIHAGLDASKDLDNQGDHFWWSSDEFDQVQSAYKPFEKVIRGYDPKHRGLYLNCITASVDDGCGFGGNLICVGFEQDGGIAGVL